MKKVIKSLLLIFALICTFKVTNVLAATNHQFSLNAYKCTTFTDDYECTDPTQLTSNGMVNPGDVIKLDLYYIPGSPTDVMMQVGVYYNTTDLEPITDGGDLYIEDLQTTYYGGIYPARGTSASGKKNTNWIITPNISNGRVLMIIEDNQVAQPLETEGVLTPVYFRVKSTATPGDDLEFRYDETYTKLANKSGRTTSGVTLKVFKQLNTNANLASITVTSGGVTYPTKETFNANTTTYNVYVPNNVSTVNVDATAAVPTGATVAGKGNQSLSVSTTKSVNLIVTAESGNVKTYTVKLYRLDNTNTLSSLALSNVTLSPSFASGTTSYTASVPYTTSSTNVSATASSSKATLSGTGSKSLAVGSNTVNVVVSPENCKSDYSSVPGNTCQTKTYTVTVTRAAASTNNYLSDLKVDGATVTGFNKNTLEYTLTPVAASKSSIAIAATAEDTTATITGTGTKTLSTGNNSYNIVVKAQSGAERTYKINVKRLSNDALLKSLSVTSNPSGSLVPSFASGTVEYTYTVGPHVTAVTITGTANATTSTVTGNGTYNPQEVSEVVLTVKAEDGTEKDYTVNLVRTKSTDNTLKALSVEGYTINPAFSANTTSYTLTVPSTVTSVNVIAEANDTLATVTGDGNKTLSIGSNTATVKVKAESGAEKTYTITITRKNNDATLKSLSLSGVTLTPTFASGTTSYTATVPFATTSTTVSAETNDTKATVTGTGSKTLAVGENTISLLVKAEDTNVTKTYRVVVTRAEASTNVNLADLKVDGVTVPGFNKNTNEYTLTPVAANKSSINITATAEDTTATITGTGTKTLSTGNNSFDVVVKAQDGTTINTYTINVKRLSNDALLKSLSVTSNPSGSLVPSFASGTIEYTYTVGPNVTEVNIEGVANATTSTVTGNGTYNPQEVNKAVLTVKAEDGTEKNYTINLLRSKSTDNTLKALSVEGYTITPSFSANTTSYTLTVPSTVENVNIIAEANDTKATVTGDGNKDLTIGANTASVKVKAESGAEKTYTITITRKNNDATLKSLSLSGITINPTFASDVEEYNAVVPYTTESTTITAQATDSKAAITGTGTENLIVGLNIIRVNVKAEDRDIEKTYTVNIIREDVSTNNKLSDLKVNGETIPGFDPDVTEYTLDPVSNDTDSITIDADAQDDDATVAGTGTQPLTVGNNDIVITVTAEDGTEKEYTIHVPREENDNNYLATLVVEGYTLTPSFVKTTENYTLTVPATVASLNVTATPEVTTTTVAGTGTINLTDDETTIVITATSQKGHDREYKIVVTKEDDAEFITSIAYGHTIEDGMIKTVEYKSKPEQLRDQLDNENSKLHIWDSESTAEVDEEGVLATGMIVKLVVNNVLKDYKTIIIKGDVNGDGEIALLDAVLVLNHYLEKSLLEGVYFEAADVNSDGDVGLLDAVMILNIYLAN